MKKGHMELREILVIALLVVGVAAAIILLLGQGSPAPQAPAETNKSVPDSDVAMPDAVAETNVTQAQTQNDTPAALAQTTNKTTGELLDEGMARADTRFYAKGLSGQFDIRTNRWALGLFNESPDSMPVKENDIRVSEIRFDGRYIDPLRGFAFKEYVSEGQYSPNSYFGTMVFLSNSTIFDSYLANTTIFDMQYDPHPELSQRLEGCSVLSSSAYATLSNSSIMVYDFECKLMYGA